MAAITTGAGIGDLVPRHISEMIVVTILIICIKFVVAVFLGEMSALVQNYTYSLVNFDHGMLKLEVSKVDCGLYHIYNTINRFYRDS